MKKNIIAIIPARSGSKGIPLKNIYPLAGYPLIAYSIIAAKLSKEISRIIVSTDSVVIAEMAKKYGAEVPFLRPKEISGDQSPDKDFVDHAINWFLENEKTVPEYLIHLRPTTPLRDPAVIDLAIQEMKRNPQATSLRSGHPCSESPLKWFVKGKNGYFQSLKNDSSGDEVNQPRQSFPAVYIPDGYVDVLKVSCLQIKNSLHGDKMIGYVSPQCQEVDIEEDILWLTYEIEKKGSPLLEYLQQNFYSSYGVENHTIVKANRHTGIVVRDLEKSLQYYVQVLGFSLIKRATEKGSYIETLVGIKDVVLEWVKLKVSDGSIIELLQYHSHPDLDCTKKVTNMASNRLGCSHGAFTVKDIDILYAKLMENGYQCCSKPQKSPDGKVKVMYGYDPDGIILEFVEEIK